MSLKKQITISPDLLKGAGRSIPKKEKKEKNKSNIKMNKPSKLKKEFLKRIKNHRENINKDKSDIDDVAFSSDFQESMKYLMEMMKNSNNNKTLKRKPVNKPIVNSQPDVNLSVPTELINTPLVNPIPNIENMSKIQSLPIVNVQPLVPKVPIQTNLEIIPNSPMTTSMMEKSELSPINTNYIKTDVLPDVPYGILKKGNKPTYRTWYNKTHKNRPILDTNINKVQKTERQEKLDNLKNKMRVFSKPNISYDKNKTYKKKKYSTIKRKYLLGRNKTKRKISVLIKNKDLRARVQVERSMLRAKPLHIMKDYLYSHGILKVGNNAPKDLIKKLYEESILAGEVNNISKDVLIHNYFNKKDD